MLFQCWASAAGGWSTLKQHWVNVSRGNNFGLMLASKRVGQCFTPPPPPIIITSVGLPLGQRSRQFTYSLPALGQCCTYNHITNTLIQQYLTESKQFSVYNLNNPKIELINIIKSDLLHNAVDTGRVLIQDHIFWWAIKAHCPLTRITKWWWWILGSRVLTDPVHRLMCNLMSVPVSSHDPNPALFWHVQITAPSHHLILQPRETSWLTGNVLNLTPWTLWCCVCLLNSSSPHLPHV